MKITMLGPSGVGKTTALAVMFNRFSRLLTPYNLELKELDQPSHEFFTKRVAALRAQFGKSSIELYKLPPNTIKDRITARYAINRNRFPPLNPIKMEFFDYPGELTSPRHDLHKEVKKVARESIGYMMPIDSGALMERGGAFNDLVNTPAVVEMLLNAALDENLAEGAESSKSKEDIEREGRRLILLAPIKCETYVQNNQHRKELFNRVRETYARTIAKCNANASQFALAIVPMQTMGNVRFHDINLADPEKPEFIYHKLEEGVIWEPRDVEVPILLMVNFTLKYHLDYEMLATSDTWGPFKAIRRTLGRWWLDRDLKRAIEGLAEQVNDYSNYQIVTGHKLLSVSKDVSWPID